MTDSLAITLAVLLGAMAVFVSDRVRSDVVALLAALVLGVTGVLTPQEVFSGFSRSAVVTIAAIFVVADGLRRAGATRQAGSLLARLAGDGEARLVTSLMIAGAGLSLFMNNIAAAAVLLPAAASAARRSGVSASRLMMPLAFATTLGGMATLLTTTNIVASGVLRSQGLPGFGLLDFAPVGAPIAVAGIAYMALVGRRMLPAMSPAERVAAEDRARDDLVELYGLDRGLFQVVIPPGSRLHNRTLGETSLRDRFGAEVVAVQHDGHTHQAPSPDTRLQSGDVLLLAGDPAEVRRLDEEPYFELLPSSPWHDCDLESGDVVVAEAVVAPRSSLLGRTLREVHFRTKYGLNVLAIWRGGQVLRTRLSEHRLEYGDALLVQGARSRIPILRAERDLLLYGDPAESPDEAEVLPSPRRRRAAWLILGVTLALAALRADMVAEVMLGSALVMVLVGILTMDDAYEAVDWRTVFLVAGMLPVGIAMTKSGAAALMGELLTHLVAPFGAWALVAAFVLVAAALAQTMHGAVVAALVVPVAVQAAATAGLEPRSFAMAIALATSMAFATPLGHPVNVLAMGFGGYRFKDYVRVGVPLTVLAIVLLLATLPVFWPLAPH